jgi:endonuclease YncB( thermonuclease family)
MSTRNKIYTIVIITTMFLLSSCQEQRSTKVIQVIDGDTVIIENGYHVRYIGIDAPEKGEAYYLESTY